jgi:hypothetical protein
MLLNAVDGTVGVVDAGGDVVATAMVVAVSAGAVALVTALLAVTTSERSLAAARLVSAADVVSRSGDASDAHPIIWSPIAPNVSSRMSESRCVVSMICLLGSHAQQPMDQRNEPENLRRCERSVHKGLAATAIL